VSLQVQLFQVCDHCGGTGTEQVYGKQTVRCWCCQGVGRVAEGPMVPVVVDDRGVVRIKIEEVR